MGIKWWQWAGLVAILLACLLGLDMFVGVLLAFLLLAAPTREE